MPTPQRVRNKTVRQLREMAREDARQFIEKFWDDDRTPLDVVKLARSAGAEVFIAQLGEDVYGMIEGTPSGATIYVDRDSSNSRQRFSIAHELGHMYSYKDEAGVLEYVDSRSDAGVGTAAEIYANEFAGELLMPEGELRILIDAGYSNASIGSCLGVSMSAVAYRRQVLGI